MGIKVNLFFRRSQVGFYSIETVFKNIEPFLREKFDVVNLQLPDAGLGYKSLRKNLKFASQNKAQVNHITGHINYIALTTGKNTVLTIHDMISALQGNYLKRIVVLYFWFWLPALFAKRITVISEQTKKEVFKYIPFAKSKVVLIYNPINGNYRYMPKVFDATEPNILCVGTKANKNLNRIFNALASINCRLTIIGKLSSEKKQLLHHLNINFQSLEKLSDKEILEAYQNCDILCFASLYEGFGMPIIEAQAVGRPVLTSKLGAMYEVAAASAHLVDPYNEDDINKGLKKIINDEDYRDGLIKKGLENSKRFRANYIANQYIEIYRDILST